MNIISQHKAHRTMDGDGVNISRVADFTHRHFDPFLMIDELKSDDKADYIGGFPPHPHRGIETFSYILKGGMEHKDQLGNVKAIQAGDVQWMSTGSGVIHSEMPLADSDAGLHGFQIWLNMPASEKMRPARYQDTTNTPIPEISNSHGAKLRALAGNWNFAGQTAAAPIQELAGKAEIADLVLDANGSAELTLKQHQFVGIYLYAGQLTSDTGQIYNPQQLLLLDAKAALRLTATIEGAGMLLFAGTPIKEDIVHMGPFVMNSQAEIRQAIDDYQNGRFGDIPST
ncbi:pirin family protein [Shewanella sp. KX20019]|uniref:pirin family protein n=1 Tax=Shewanella sp. KX20019 TaxID=2803864 RepID=UPI001928BEFA|nr:pirin family protein [Shewanella sp. KX20019]QQX79423.1 pirin family protein [Shewanella sp. KX20019]